MRHGKVCCFLAVLMFAALDMLGFSRPALAAGTNYYIDNQPDSNCSDAGPHSIAQPWCTFTPLNRIRTFAPGDQILLARGGAWNQEMTLAGSGTPSEHVTLAAYGAGADPKILRSQGINEICILLTDGSYWDIRNLEVGRASAGIIVHYTQLFNNEINISNIYVHDNKGIWGGYSTEHPVSQGRVDPFAASLNVNLSSGILFNTSSNLTFSSSQYVLKGVSVSNIRGTNNLDSVAFDGEANTTDDQDGHNAFQDVTLNNLFLYDDNGHAAKVYQAAGLGCSDSLRLLGMTNVTLLNSVLYNEAGCHTETGTAAVILGRVSNVTFVNNIIFGVPASNSPDETGIDLEWSESHVNLHANLFSANAGSAVEILNIHKGDHTTDVDFYDNTFVNNSLAHHPGEAAVWESYNGDGYATPTGKVRNNLYTEVKGTFLAGQNVASISSANNLASLLTPSYAAAQFSSGQGKNQWRYLYEPSESNWTDLPVFSATDHNGAWQVSPAHYVSAFNLAPASCSGSCDAGGVARAWVAPRDGIVSIRGQVLKSDARGGTGVHAVIHLVSGRTVTRIWPASGRKQLIAGTDQMGFATDVDNIPVSAGDMIRFEVTANGDNSYDTVSWTPSVAYLAPRAVHSPNLDPVALREASLRRSAVRSSGISD